MLNEFAKKIAAIETLEIVYELVDNQKDCYNQMLKEKKTEYAELIDAGKKEDSWQIKDCKKQIESYEIKIETTEEVITKITEMM